MEVLVILVPLALGLGLVGLLAFLWSLKNGQYDDLEGAAWRAIADDEPQMTGPEAGGGGGGGWRARRARGGCLAPTRRGASIRKIARDFVSRSENSRFFEINATFGS